MSLAALQERPFRLLWLGRTASTFGDSLVPVALAFAVLRIGGGAAGIGYVLAAFSAAQVVFLLAGGVFGDRLPRRLVMLACDAIRAAVDVFIAVALLAGFMELWMFVAASAVFGAAGAFFLPASNGLVPQTVSPARLQEANGLLAVSGGAARVGAPGLSGLIVAVAHPGWVFAIDAVTFLVSAWFLARLRVKPAAVPAVRQRFLADLADGFRAVRSRTWLVAGIACLALVNFAIAGWQVLGPVVAEDELGGAAAWGLVGTAGAIGALAGGVAAMRIRTRRPLVWCFALWLLGPVLLLAIAPPLPLVAIALASAVWGLGATAGNTLWDTMMQREVPEELRARVYSFDMLACTSFLPAGQALAGPAAAALGLRPTLLLGAALMGVPCLVALALPAVRGLEHDGPVAVHEDPVLELPPHGPG